MFQSNAFQPNAFEIGKASAGGGGSVAYSLSGATGSYTLTGNAATFKVGRLLSGAVGSYTYSGTAATFKVGRLLSGAVGSYTYTGTAGTLSYVPGAGSIPYALSGATGSYTLTGNAATFKVGRLLSGAAGSYAVTGNSGTLSYVSGAGSVAYSLSGASGSYVLSGGSGSFDTSGVTQTHRRSAGGRRQYEIKGKRYWLTPQELEQLVAQMLGELNRNEVVDAENKIITRRAWSKIQASIKQAESRLGFKLPIETVIVEDEDDDEEALLMLI